MADDFLATYAPLANDIATRTGVDPSVVLGIIDTETGGGKRVSGNNIFGISPGGRVAGYPDVQTAANAFISLMQTPRYAGVAAAGDPASQAAALVKGGYNTANPNYATIVAGKALSIGKQLGYQDQGGGGGPAVYSTSAQPAATASQPTAPSYSDSPTPAAAPAQPTQPTPPTTGSAKDRVLSDPSLNPDAAAAPAQPQAKPGTSAKDRVLADPALAAPATTATPQETGATEGQTTARGVARNVAAGVLEGSGGTINVLHDPIGNLIFRPITTAGAALYDIGAHATGLYNPLTPEQRADLTGDTLEYQQPGTRVANALGASDVVPQSEAERLIRAGTSGATSALQLAPGVVVPAIVGAGGGAGGQLAADYAPDWAKPYAQFGGMLVGGGAGALGAAGMIRGGNALAAAARDTTPVLEHPLAPRDPATGQPMTPAAAPAGAPGGPQPGMGAAQPAGAQVTPSAAALMTPEEIATQRTVADKQWLNQTQQPGVRDTTQHIPGITSSLVEQEQTVTAARELKALKNLNPELSQAEREILDRNTDLRKGFYADTVGSDVTRAADLKAANDKINTDLANVWQGKGEADPANVHTQIQTELAGSAGDLPPLKSAMKQVGDSLENAGTDPQAMYRTHRLINYLQSKQGQLANPGYGAGDVQAALTRVKATLAKTIDDAAPGFGKAMSDYAGARGPIDAAKALQDRENGLYDTRGHMSFLKVHALMRDIIDAQKWDAPNDPLAGVSDAQMARLKALHDDLKKVASAKDLATAQGSDTAMNAVDIAKQYGKLAGRAGVEGAANLAFGPGVGSMIVRGAENLLRPISSGVAARRQVRRGMEILQPPPGNPLQPP